MGRFTTPHCPAHGDPLCIPPQRRRACRRRDPPGEDGELGLDDLDADDHQQQGADHEDHELEESLQDSVGEAGFIPKHLEEGVPQHGQRELCGERERVDFYGLQKETCCRCELVSLSITQSLSYVPFYNILTRFVITT